MKKGIASLGLTLLVAFLAVLLMLLFYFFFLSESRVPKIIEVEESYNAAANNMLINYLNTPVVLPNGETVDFAGLIRLWRNAPQQYEQLLKQGTDDSLQLGAAAMSSKVASINFRFWLEIIDPSIPLVPYNPPLFASSTPALKMAKGYASVPVPVSDSNALMVNLYYGVV
jgi:hypothetical protein